MLKRIISIALTFLLCIGILVPAALADENASQDDASPETELLETPIPDFAEPYGSDEPAEPTNSSSESIVLEEPETASLSDAVTELSNPVSSETSVVSPSMDADAVIVVPVEDKAPSEEFLSNVGPRILDRRVTMGADLTSAQRVAVYSDFGIEMGSVPEISISNGEVRAYLQGIVSENKIGTVALSCCYIATLEEGSGLSVELHNINYCSEKMYINALTTAGIRNAYVIISAPYPVSGTSALTGIYKAYEAVTGNQLSKQAKETAAEELVLTGDLSAEIGSERAAGLISKVKDNLVQTKTMNDEEVRKKIRSLAAEDGLSLTDAQVNRILKLSRKLEKLDYNALNGELPGASDAAGAATRAAGPMSKVADGVTSFFNDVGEFFSGVFGRDE